MVLHIINTFISNTEPLRNRFLGLKKKHLNLISQKDN